MVLGVDLMFWLHIAICHRNTKCKKCPTLGQFTLAVLVFFVNVRNLFIAVLVLLLTAVSQ